MAISAVGAAVTADIVPGSTGVTLSVNATTVGDIIVVMVFSESNPGAYYPTLSSPAATGWQLIGAAGTAAGFLFMWMGVIITAGTTSLTVGVPSLAGSVGVIAQQYTAGYAAPWSLDTSVYAEASAANTPFPTLTPAASGELWLGMAMQCYGAGVAFSTTAPSGWFYATAPPGAYMLWGTAVLSGAGAVAPALTGGGAISGVPDLRLVVIVTAAPAPQAPTLVAPANTAYDDATAGVTFSATYNASVTGSPASAYALRKKVSGGSYTYWNASSSSWGGSITWNPITLANGATGGPTGPITAGLTNGTQINWSMAFEESDDSTTGPFATDSILTLQLSPTVTLTGPSAVASTTTPTISWTFAGGGTQTEYHVIYYTLAQTQASGFVPGVTPPYYDPGTMIGPATSFVTPAAADLVNGVTYVAYLQVAETGGMVSNAPSITFTVNLGGPSVPTLTAVSANDSTTNAPFVTLLATSDDNILSAYDASFEGNLGTTIAITNCAVAVNTSYALNGSDSLSIKSTASGAMVAGSATGTGGYAVVAGKTYSGMASWRALATGRTTCQIALYWYKSSGSASTVKPSSLGSVVTDTTTGWTQATVSDTAPSDAAFVQIRYLVTTTAANEYHLIDEAGIFNGSMPAAWSGGGYYLAGTTTTEFQYSDDGVTWNDLRFGAALARNAFQQATCLDYESPPCLVSTTGAVVGSVRQYRVRGVGIVGGLSIPGTWSSVVSPSTPPSTMNHWFLSDPTDPTSGAQFDLMTDPKLTVHEEDTIYYPLGRTTGIKASGGTKGVGGTVEATTTTYAAWQAILALMAGTQTLLLQAPVGQYYISLDSDRPADIGLSTFGRTDFSLVKHSMTFVGATIP
jgi:hypothetical protein